MYEVCLTKKVNTYLSIGLLRINMFVTNISFNKVIQLDISVYVMVMFPLFSCYTILYKLCNNCCLTLIYNRYTL